MKKDDNSKISINYKLDSEIIEKELFNLGVTNIKLNQHWRFIHASGYLKKKKVFVKISTNKALNLPVRNEANWNKFINISTIKTFKAPKIIDEIKLKFNSNIFNGYISEFVPGSPLIELKKAKDSDLSNETLEKITEILLELSTHKQNDPLPMDYSRKVKTSKDILYTVVSQNVETFKTTDNNLISLEHYVKSHLDYLDLSYSHGDFTPWHIFNDNDKYVVIDAERASLFGFKMSDAAYLYLRALTTIQNRDLANRMIKLFKEKLFINENDFINFKLNLSLKATQSFQESIENNWYDVKISKNIVE